MELETINRIAESEIKSKNPTPTNILPPLPFFMQIEINLVGWKGYEGVNISRDYNNETSWDLQKKLLAMDRLDEKIGPLSSAYYNKEIAMRAKFQDFSDMEFWYK